MPSESKSWIWIVSKYNNGNWNIEMYEVAPEYTISELEISLARESDNLTRADISNEITAIGMAGDGFMEEFTEIGR